MRSKPRPVSVAIVVSGIVAVLVIVIGIIVVVQMTRQGPESPATEHVGEQGHQPTRPPAIDETQTDRADLPETHEGGAAVATSENPEEAAPTAAAETSSGYSISGRVDDEAGHGLAGATVRAHLKPSIETWELPVAKEVTSDEAGAFRFDNLPREDVYLTASRGDLCFYLPHLMYEGIQGWCFPLQYLPGRDRVAGIRLTLRPGAAIAGKAFDADDQPVPNAAVKCRGYGLPGAWGAVTETETDEAGSFRITGLVPGNCYLSVEADRFMPLYGVETRAPMSEDELLLRLERGVTVRGSALVAELGTPAPGAEIRAVSSGRDMLGRSSQEVGKATADAEGNFEILVHPKAPTTLTARWEGYVSEPEHPIEITDENRSSPVTIELVKGGSISGIVREKDSELPLPGVPIRSGAPPVESLNAESNLEGRFVFDGLAPGRYFVRAFSSEYTASEPYAYVELKLGESAHAEVWASRTAAVTGTVVDADGEPIFGAIVVPNQENDQGRRWLGQRTVTDADGRFVVRQQQRDGRIAALVACHPDYCHALVELPQDETEGERDVRIVLEKGGGSIAGHVADESGEPRQQIGVSLLALDAFETSQWSPPELKAALTDEAGRYVFQSILPGTYRVRTTVYGQPFESGDVTLTAAQQIDDVDITVPASGYVAGTVKDADGAPIAGVRIGAHPELSGRVGWTRTDADGCYTIEDLVEGYEYLVYVDAEGSGWKEDTLRNVTCSADNVRFVLTRAELGTVRGFVYSNADGTPVEQFFLVIYEVGNNLTFRGTFRNADGSFECPRVRAGRSVLAVTAPGCVGFRSEPFEVKADQEVTQTVYLETGATVRGAVYRKSDGSPVTEYHIGLVQGEDGIFPSWPQAKSKVVESDNGSFEVAGLEAGTYKIVVVADGLPDFMGDPFEVTAQSKMVRNVYIGDGGIIRGTVVDESGRPVPDAIVDEGQSFGRRRRQAGAFPNDWHRPETPNRTKTDHAGAFVLRNLTPGTVSIRAEHPDYAESAVQEIEVTLDAPTEGVVIELQRGTVLHGRIKDLEGKALHGMYFGINGQDQSHSVDLDYMGRYRSPLLPRGTYTLRLRYYDAILPEVTLDGEDEVEFNVDFTQAGTISGKVNVPSQPEDLTVRVHLQGLDDLRGMRSENVANDGTFEFQAVFEGKYQISVQVWQSDDRHNPFELTTNPKAIVVSLSPKETVRQDINVVEIKEPNPR